MDKLIRTFIDQLEEGINIGKSSSFKPAKHSINNVVITGLGGSGIGGKIVSQITSGEVKVPVLTNNDYSLPAFVDQNTLLIVCSYSGNTEETLSAVNIAIDKGAEIACITSGGQVEQIAKEKGYNHIVIPGGNPPRACLPYSFTEIFYVLAHYELISWEFENSIQSAINLLTSEETSIHELAKVTAKKLHGKTPIIYSEVSYEGVCIRFRQQINENAKQLCWHHVLPEMNHNELVGWAGGKSEYEVILFRNEDDYSKTKIRMEISKKIISEHSNITEIISKGENKIERSLYLIYLGDWISYYLSVENAADPIEIRVIDYLKSELAKY